MRKIGYFLATILLATILIYQGFFQEQKNTNNGVEFDFSDNSGSYLLTKTEDSVTKKILQPNQKIETTSILYDKITAADGIYHTKWDTFESTYTNNKLSIKLNNGNYILAFTDLYREYEILWTSYNIQLKTPGYIFIQNSPSGAKIYSYSAILDVKLLQNTQVTTQFDLLPSLLFSYDPSQNSRLEKADVIRISTINSLFYIDARSPDFDKKIFGLSTAVRRRRGAPETTSNLLPFATTDIQNELVKYESLTNTLAKKNLFTIGGTDFIENYPFLFVNDSKKDAYLKNKLLTNLVSLLQKEKSDQNLESVLREMKDIGESRYLEWKKIIIEFARIVFYSQKSNQDLSSQNNNPLLNIDKEIASLRLSPLTTNTYLPLSKLYTNYAFYSDSSRSTFELGLNDYLKLLLEKHRITKDGFSVFSHFLSQYLTQNNDLSQKTFSIVSYFISLSEWYYNSIQDNPTTQGEYLKNILYSYTKILTQLQLTLDTTFFEKTADTWVKIKEKYLSRSGREIEQNIVDIDGLKSLLVDIDKDLGSKKAPFYSFFWVTPAGERDNYMLTIENFEQLKHTYGIFSDYPAYLNNLALNEANKEATRLSVETPNTKKTLSMNDLVSYLSQFNGLKRETIRPTNNFETDGYYAVEVKIEDSDFFFKLYPNKKNTIENIIYTDSAGQKNTTNQSSSIVLDEREEKLREERSSYEDVDLKFKYDFKNTFLVLFLTKKITGDTVKKPTETQKPMTPQMKSFVQDNLINGDFKTIAGFFPIPPASIYTNIENGEYKTEISSIKKSFSNKNGESWYAEFEGAYSFASHSFVSLRFSVLNDQTEWYDLGWYKVDIYPQTINIRDLEQTLSPLMNYISVLRSHYSFGAKNLKIDLNSKKVYIDSQSFDVIY